MDVVELDVPDLSEAGHCPLEHLGLRPRQLAHLLQDLTNTCTREKFGSRTCIHYV